MQAIDAQRTRMPRRHKQLLPAVPTCTEETEWRRWTSECAKQKALAKQEYKQLKAEYKKKVAQAREDKVSKDYWQRQKQCNKQILGKSSKQGLDAVQDPVTHEVQQDPSKLRECVYKYLQNMARPAVGKSKTDALLPTQAPRGYP